MAFVRLKRDEPLLPSISLVGMAGAGKSTLGRLLADRLGWAFFDTDRHLEATYGVPLQTLMDQFGVRDFLRIEEELVGDLRLHRTVISTGGSVIYGALGMARLKESGPVVLLDIGLATFLSRVGDAEGRGLAISPGSTLEALYNERQPLYRAAADFTVRTDDRSPDACVQEILDRIELP